MSNKISQRIAQLLCLLMLLTMASCHKKQSTKVIETQNIVDTTTVTPPHQPVVPVWQPKYKSAYCKATCSIRMQNNVLSAPVTLSYLADSIVVLSLQSPLLGMEIGRAEATHAGVVIIDKMGRRYAQCSYEEISRLMGLNASFIEVERRMEEEVVVAPVNKELSYDYQGVTAMVVLRQLATDVAVNAMPCRLERYTQTNIDALLSMLLSNKK